MKTDIKKLKELFYQQYGQKIGHIVPTDEIIDWLTAHSQFSDAPKGAEKVIDNLNGIDETLQHLEYFMRGNIDIIRARMLIEQTITELSLSSSKAEVLTDEMIEEKFTYYDEIFKAKAINMGGVNAAKWARDYINNKNK